MKASRHKMIASNRVSTLIYTYNCCTNCIPQWYLFINPISYGSFLRSNSIVGRLILIRASYAIGFFPDGASVLITLPIDMKKPNVAPEPSIYVPSILKGPCVPAPYLMILKPPARVNCRSRFAVAAYQI